MLKKINRFAWISTLIDIANKPDKIQVFRQNWSCDDVIYPQSRPLGSFNLDEWQKLAIIYMCQIRTIIPNINRYKDLVEWLSSFNLVLLAIKKKSFTYMLAKSDATVNSIEYQEMILFQITINNNSVSVDTLL